MRIHALLLLLLFAAPVRAETVSYLSWLIDSRGVGGNIYAAPGVYAGLKVADQWNPLTVQPPIGSPLAVTFDGISVSDTPVIVFAFDVIKGPITVREQSWADFIFCLFLGSPQIDVTRGSAVGLYDDVVVAPPAPEPQAWAMMLVGVGLTGGAIRGRRAWPTRARPRA